VRDVRSINPREYMQPRAPAAIAFPGRRPEFSLDFVKSTEMTKVPHFDYYQTNKLNGVIAQPGFRREMGFVNQHLIDNISDR